MTNPSVADLRACSTNLLDSTIPLLARLLSEKERAPVRPSELLKELAYAHDEACNLAQNLDRLATMLQDDDQVVEVVDLSLNKPTSTWRKRALESSTVSEAPETSTSLPSHLKTLNEGQQAAFDAINAWIKRTDENEFSEPFFVVMGPAGTGKSTLMAHVKHYRPTVIPTALTNKACRVLSSMLRLPYPCKTIFSALGLVLQGDEDGELVLVKSERAPKPIYGSVYLVDEASMAGRQITEEMRKAASIYNLRFILIGDPFQLPPVKENVSPAWKLEAEKAKLTQIMRFDSSLLDLSLEIRQRIKAKDYRVTDLFQASDEIQLETRRFKDLMVEGIVADPDNVRGIAWTNKRVDEYNQAVRAAYGFLERFEVNDRLLVAKPIEVDGEIVSSIDDDVTVRSVAYLDDFDYAVLEPRLRATNIETRLEVWQLTVDGDYKGTLTIPASTEAQESLMQALARHAKSRKSPGDRMDAWKMFWKAKASFHSVRYAYCLTAHRSQGSTFTRVFVDVPNINSNSDRRTMMKCLYVACSRASQKLIVNNDL